MDERAVDLRVSVYEADTLPFGLRFRKTLVPLTDGIALAPGGIPTGTSGTLSVTIPIDSDPGPPDSDYSEDLPAHMI